MLAPLGLIALVAAMLITLYEMRTALRPATCPECGHCRTLAASREREQEQLAREYAKRVGLPDEDADDDRRID